MLGPGHAHRRHHLQVRINGDVALLRAWEGLLELEAPARGRCSTTPSSTGTPTASRLGAQHLREPWPSMASRSRACRGRRSSRSPRRTRASPRGHRLLGHGPHPARERRGQRPAAITNLLLLRGNIGRPAPASARCAATPTCRAIAPWASGTAPARPSSPRSQARLGLQPPRGHGFNVVEAIAAMHTGRVDVFMALGGNFHLGRPDTAHTAAAMARCGLTGADRHQAQPLHLVTARAR
jgi:hypothetical protein